MDEITREPMTIRAEDINPRYNWGRALPAFGTMGVDFEERVDYRRLHRYRLGRIKAALENSELGALLVFDVNNIAPPAGISWRRRKMPTARPALPIMRPSTNAPHDAGPKPASQFE